MDPARPPIHEQARFELKGEPIKSESTAANSPQLNTLESAPHQPDLISPSQPIPSTEADPSNSNDMSTQKPGGGPKKKGTAKKAPKKPKAPKPKDSVTQKSTPDASAKEDPEDEPMGDAPASDDESDNGPYCLCRGPDDHRWMICCEKCEDWFHGECINLSKDIGESLIEKFICPNCTVGNLTTLYKKTCGLGACRKPARLTVGEGSVFCSNDHAQMWWERMVGRLPKSKAKVSGLNDQMTQEEFMALLDSGLAVVGEDGMFKLAKVPFQSDASQFPNGDSRKSGTTPSNDMSDTETEPEQDLSDILSPEEKLFLEQTANTRYHLGEETALCGHMLTIIELAQKRRRAVIDAGRIGDDICGYDYRLDTISARDAFAAFIKSPQGDAILESKELGVPPAENNEEEEDLARGMCERRRCKSHQGWLKTFNLAVKYQIKEMVRQAAEVGEEERVVREAAMERSRRKKAETNWVEVL